MKARPLEPGLVNLLRLYVILSAVIIPLTWRAFGPMLGVDVFSLFLTPGELGLVFLIIYLSFSWWQQRMGRAFLPAALILLAAQAVIGNNLLLRWIVPAQFREVAALAFMARTWVMIQFLVLFVAWQYDVFWVMVAGIGISLLDAALVFPLVPVGGVFYPFYISLVVGRLLSVTAAGLGFAWLMQRQREQRAALAEANQKLTAANLKLAQSAATLEQLAISQERNRLARELHDTLAHSLSSITVQLEAAEAIWGVDMAKVRTLMDGALNNTRNGLTEARRALQALRAGALEEVGLRVAVEDLARSIAARGNLTLDLKMPDQLPALTQAEEQCFYRVAQEGLSNVWDPLESTCRHASLSIL